MKYVRSKYLNIFVIALHEETLSRLIEDLEKLCKDVGCSIEVHRSKVLKEFTYLKVSPPHEGNLSMETLIHRIKQLIESVDGITWYKIELIKVK